MDENNNPLASRPASTSATGATGSVVATIVILAVLIVGAVYFWSQRTGMSDQEALDSINAQSASDDSTSIEADLKATDVNKVDYDLNPTNFTSS